MKIVTLNLKALLKTRGITAISLATKLWPDSSADAQKTNASNLMNGRVKSINLQMVGIICEELQCEPNDIFEIE